MHLTLSRLGFNQYIGALQIMCKNVEIYCVAVVFLVAVLQTLQITQKPNASLRTPRSTTIDRHSQNALVFGTHPDLQTSVFAARNRTLMRIVSLFFLLSNESRKRCDVCRI